MTTKQPQGKRRPSSTSGVSRSYSQMYKSSAAGASAPATAAAVKAGDSVPATLRGSDEVDWRGEYGYVLDDLRLLAIVTSVLVVAIVVAGIFL